jgi:hypothetical protein
MRRIARLFFTSLIILLCTLGLVSGSADPSSDRPAKGGVWLKRVAMRIYPCPEHPKVTWGWEDEGTKMFLLDNDGEQKDVWDLSEPFSDGYFNSKNCGMIWIVSKDRLNVFAANMEIPGQVFKLSTGQQLAGEVENILPVEDLRAAWVLARQDNGQHHLIKLEVDGTALRMIPQPNFPQDFNFSAYTDFLGSKRIFFVPENSEGLNLVQDGEFRSVAAFNKIKVFNVLTASDDRFVWVFPKEKGGGVYLADADGEVLNGGQPILPGQTIQTLYIPPRGYVSDIAWIITTEKQVFAARMSAQTRTIELLNGGRPLSLPSGVPLEGGGLATPNGNVAWILPSADRAVSRMVVGLWHATVEGDGTVTTAEIPPPLYGSKKTREIFAYVQIPDRAWLKTDDYSIYEIRLDEKGVDGSLLIQRVGGIDVSAIAPIATPGRFWVQSDINSYLMGSADELQTATVKTQGGTLTLASQGKQRLSGDLNDPFGLEVDLDWPAKATSNGTVSVQVFAPSPTGQHTLVAEGSGRLSAGRGQLQVVPVGAVKQSDVYELELTYLDDLGSRLTVTWPSVVFKLYILERILRNSFVKSLLLLLVPTGLILVLFGNRLAIRKWAPVAIPLMDVCVIKLAPEFFSLDLLTFTFSAVLLFIFFIAAGLASPWLFHRLASVQPFTLMASVVLMFPKARRHVFREYLATLRRDLADQRRKANDEEYVPLPIKAEAARPSQIAGESELMTAEQITQLITDPDSRARAHLVIHGPGGRGKSALLNEILERAIDAFTRDPRCPLPVMGDRRFKKFEEMIGWALSNVGGDVVSSRLLESGDLVLFIDDLGESQVEPSNIQMFMGSSGRMTRICTTIRSGATRLEALDRGDRVLTVSPARLDEGNLATFVERYRLSDAKKSGDPGGAPVQLPKLDNLAAICKSPDGSYLPLLVRLAMRATVRGRELTSVSDIYEGSLERLLKQTPIEDEQLWRDIEELARVTYWEEHTRLIATTRATAGLAQLINSLLKAGVLVRADREESLVRSTPRQVRFFHDSVQSYLAARALSRAARWDALAAAAGEDWFQRARSDILGGTTSELFAMCVEVFRPVDRLRKFLAEQLRDWQAHFHGELTARQVIESVPVWLKSAMLEAVEPSSGAAECLKAAIAICQAEDEREDSATNLGVLYGHLALYIWPLIKAAAASIPKKAA